MNDPLTICEHGTAGLTGKITFHANNSNIISESTA